MATIVAVHGAMHGGWAWSRLRPILIGAGHEMYTPSLTGQGDRSHLLTRSVGVQTHVTDITAVIDFEDLYDVVLVLHSYAGLLAGPVVEQRSDRIRSVVLAGAFYVRPGQSLLDVEPLATAGHYRAQAREAGDGWKLPANRSFLAQWGITDPELQEFVGSRLVDFPFKAQTDVVTYDPVPLHNLSRTYIEHTRPPLASLAHSQAAALEDGFDHETIDTGHDMMLANPVGTAELIAGIAAR